MGSVGPIPGPRVACVAALSLWILLVSGCGRGAGGGGGGRPEPVIEVSVSQPQVTLVEDLVPAVGSIEPEERVVLQPEVPGLIESIHFEEGQRVRKGEVLFRLRARKEEAQLAQARAEKSLAQANLDRARTLAGTKAISQQELDLMESTLAAREATLDLESRRLEDTVVSAPFDGVLGQRQVSVGQHVQAGTPLATLVEDARVKVLFRLPERLLSSLKVGQTGRISVSSFPGRTFDGILDLIDPEVEPTGRTIQARLRLPNPEGLLRPGMFARVELVTGQRPQALVVPESAIVPSLDAFAVFVVEAEHARICPVRLGARLPGRVEILEGVSASTEVILSGTQKLVDGIRIKPVSDAALAARKPVPAAGGSGGAVEASGK